MKQDKLTLFFLSMKSDVLSMPLRTVLGKPILFWITNLIAEIPDTHILIFKIIFWKFKCTNAKFDKTLLNKYRTFCINTERTTTLGQFAFEQHIKNQLLLQDITKFESK